MSIISKVKSFNTLFKKAQKMSNVETLYPDSATIDITYDCNLRCKMCWRSENASPQNLFDGTECGLEEHKTIIDILFDKGVKHVVIAGGEPLIKPWALDYLKYIKDKGMTGTLITNGTLLNKKTSKFLVNINWDFIMFSIDGPNEKTYKYIRGNKNFKKLLKNIKFLSNFKKSKKSKLTLFSNTIIMNSNKSMLHEMIKLASELGISSVGFARLTPWSTNFDMLNVQLEDKQVKTSLHHAIKLSKKLKINTNAKKILSPQSPLFCSTVFSNINIDPAGNVLICCKIQKRVGNLLKDDFDKIWFGSIFIKFRQLSKNGKLPKVCETCYLDNVTSSNLIYFLRSRKPIEVMKYIIKYYL